MARMPTASFFEKLSRLTWSGVLRCFVLFIRVAIFPISVAIPVSVTRTFARPYVTREPEKTMFFRSPRAASPSISPSVLSTPRDSPVRADSSTLRAKFSIMRPSAGTRSPASSKITSPGTTSAEGISSLVPSRSTFVMGEDIALRLARDFSAFAY